MRWGERDFIFFYVYVYSEIIFGFVIGKDGLLSIKSVWLIYIGVFCKLKLIIEG